MVAVQVIMLVLVVELVVRLTVYFGVSIQIFYWKSVEVAVVAKRQVDVSPV